MHIASVETELYKIPRGPGLASASARIEATSMLVARIRSEDGLGGYGVDLQPRLGRSKSQDSGRYPVCATVGG